MGERDLLVGAGQATVREAMRREDPLPGTNGFAGRVDEFLVRDVLGRYPLFFEAEDPSDWSYRPQDLSEPQALPAGHRHDGSTSEHCWRLPAVEPETSDDAAVNSLRTAIETTLAEVDSTDLAIGFSGGVDSAILAAHLDAPLFTIGFPDSHDIEAARSAAEQIDRDLTVIEIDPEMLERAVPEVARAIQRTNAMDVQIALGFSLLAERVSDAGFDRLALGQGADELFGGYAKVEKAPDDPRVDATTVRAARREVLHSLPGQLERDTLAIRERGVEPVVPLLHDRIVRCGLELSGRQLVSNGTRKWALRQAATDWLPTGLSSRDKKAFQYGSLVARELDRLARQAGFKRRMDDHVTKYVEHRC
jgi:asparagine synthase (glutamine-hydrolysing)